MANSSTEDWVPTNWIRPKFYFPAKYKRIWEETIETSSKQKQVEQMKRETKKSKKVEQEVKNLGLQLKKLSVKKDDIIIVHLTCAPKPGLAELVHQLADMKPIKDLHISVLVLPQEIEIGTMSEVDMNKAGWYKRGHRLVRPIT